jgi:predicted ester cyclase
MSAKDLKARARHFVEEWNKGKAAALAFIDEHWAADVVLHSGFGRGDIHGLKDNKQFLSAAYDACPDIHYTLDDVVVEGDKVALRYTWTGTHKGAFLGIPPTNKKITVWEIEIDRIVNGKLVECWARLDTLGLMQQLGVVPTPGKGK